MEYPKNLDAHEQLCEDGLRKWRMLGGERQRGKNWDNCNSKINKT